jgi:Chaperone of endosialidase/Uncharacterized conserved protein (DUF2190)
MGDDITIGVTEIVNNIEVTAQPNDQIVDISVIDNTDEVTLNITPTVIEINVNKGSSFAKWGDILGTLSDQEDLQDALDLKADLVDGKVPSSQLPSYVDDVIEVANYAALPVTGESGKIYITIDNNHIFRWTGSIYVEITDNTAVWGAITGTLSSQTDLVTALNLRVPYTGATGNVNLGEYGLTSGYLKLDTTPTSTPTTIGTIFWDAANRTAALIDGDGDTTLQIGQEQRILVHNNTGSTLTDGQVVYVTGSTGNLPSVSLADATSETTSAATIGVVTESIANGADGFITISGIVNGLNTLAFDEGDLLWLSTTAGAFTTTKPASPAHLVLIGYVIKKAGGNGSILVKIQNTQELSESSDVLFTSLANNDILTYESSSSLWKNKSLGTIFGGTSSQFVKGNGTLDSTSYQPLLTNPITGTGTTNYLPKFTGSTALGNSLIFDNGTSVGIGTSSPSAFAIVDANGQFRVSNLSVQGFYQARTSDSAGSGIYGGNSFVLRNGATSEDLNFDVFNRTSSAWYTPLIIKNTGNVGIGTTSPSYKLDVAGVGRFLGTTPLTLERSGSTKYTFSLGASDDFYINNVNIGTTPLTILSSGNVGIGTTSPSSKLHVVGKGIFDIGANSGDVLVVDKTSGGNIAFNINGVYSGQIGAVGSGDLYIASKSTYPAIVVKDGGNVGIGTTSPSFQLQLSNDSAAKPGSPLWTVSSDIRIKENVRPYTDGLEKLMQVNPVYYDYNGKAGFSITKDNVGIIAQEMQEVLPNTIKTFKAKLNDDDEEETELLSFNANEIIYVLINSVKELKAEIELLKQK